MLKKLAKESKNFNDTDFLKAIDDACDNCEVCEQFKRPPLRPVVGLRLADNFNETVCMDLKEHVHGQSWILHLIDAATRYSTASLIYSKRQEEVVKKIFNIWISYFGAPKMFLSDNGGEFANETFREMGEKFNIVITITAAESPWSNGTVERHNAFIYESMMKTMKDSKCDADMALAWAVSAKNSLSSRDGFSPNQLVFGRNVSLPSVLDSELPALENRTSSDIVRMNLNSMHRARENFIKAESSERIQRALRHKVRSYSDEIFENGDQVYYRWKETKGWRGPGIVLGKEGQYVLIRHASAYYHIHPCQLMKTNAQNGKDIEFDESEESIKKTVTTVNMKTSDSDSECCTESAQPQNTQNYQEDTQQAEGVEARDQSEEPGTQPTISQPYHTKAKFHLSFSKQPNPHFSAFRMCSAGSCI